MNQQSTNESYSLLTLAKQILDKAKERARHQCVKADVKEVWDILQMLGVRPSVIGSSAAEIRQVLRTGHIAEARRIFMNASSSAAGMEELNAAFKVMSENLVTAMRMPPPPPPSIAAPAVSTETVCAVVLMRDPFQNPPEGAVSFSQAIALDEANDDGTEALEVSESDIQAVDVLEGAANDSARRDSTPQSLETPHDQALVELFFGGRKAAKEFGFVPASKPQPLSTEALLAEMQSVLPPHSDEVACAVAAEDEPMPASRHRRTSEAVGGYAS